MKGSTANVTSIDALRDFRVALRDYELAVRDVLDCLGVEVSRGVDWVTHDRSQYWPRQSRRAEQKLATARGELEMAQLASLKNENRSCLQEKKNVELATARLRHCEDQIRLVKRWRHLAEHGSQEHKGKVARLIHYLDSDIPRALAALDRMISSLEQYSERARGADPPTAAAD
jgi:hypothetical protein